MEDRILIDGKILVYDAAARYMDQKEKERDQLIRRLHEAWVSEYTPILLEVRDYPRSYVMGLGAFELGANYYAPKWEHVILNAKDFGGNNESNKG